MKLSLNGTTLLDSYSPFNGKQVNLFIEDGVIKSISSSKKFGRGEVIDFQGTCMSPGFFDLRCSLGDPGFEYKEDLVSGTNAAAAGGFTEIACLPDTYPVIDHKEAVYYIKNSSKRFLTQVHPLGALTKNNKEQELADLLDLKAAGAVGFTEVGCQLSNSELVVKALEYLKHSDGVYISFPQDRNLIKNGQVHEGKISASLGMKGIPSSGEKLAVLRMLELLRYSGGRVHFSNVSTKDALKMIKSAKEEGLKVTCDIAAHQIAFTSDDMIGFDTNLKVLPPFRESEDNKALIQGLVEGTIDCVVSSHTPHEIDSKLLEFDYAEFGVSSLETTFAVLNTYGLGLTPELIVKLLAFKPREILGLKVPRIEEGEKANVTVFNSATKWSVNGKNLRSKSGNNPFINKNLKGKIKFVCRGEKYLLNE